MALDLLLQKQTKHALLSQSNLKDITENQRNDFDRLYHSDTPYRGSSVSLSNHDNNDLSIELHNQNKKPNTRVVKNQEVNTKRKSQYFSQDND